MRWGRALAAGGIVGVTSYLLLYPVIFGYTSIVPLLGASVQPSLVQFTSAYGTVGTPLVHLLLVLLATFWVVRRMDSTPVTYGVLIALVSVAVYESVMLLLNGVLFPVQAAALLVMALGGGVAGGVMGRGQPKASE